MGVAIFVPNVSFAAKNLGKVTVVEDIPLTAISIVGDDVVDNSQNTATYSVGYTPSNTSHRGVNWSITSGSQYASIDQSGNLIVNRSGDVTIKATSTDDPTISATKTINVVFNIDAIYIKTTNNAYLDSGIKDDEVGRVEAEFKTAKNISNAFILGTSTADDKKRYGIRNDIDGSSVYSFMLYQGNTRRVFRAIEATKEYKAVLADDGIELIYNGESIEGTADAYSGGPNSLNIYLFACNREGNAYSVTSTSSVHIKSVKMFNKQGDLVKHFVGTEKDGTACMYEVVSGTYVYPTNSGSTFVKA